MIKSIHFRVKKWDYNKNAKLVNTKTDSNLATHPLRSNKQKNAEGLAFVWYLTLKANDMEVLYYSSEEYFLIPDRPITDEQLLNIVKQSYDRTSQEVAMRNLNVGLDAGFPPFEKHPIDLKEIKKVLDM
jgi:hypothetical protein